MSSVGSRLSVLKQAAQRTGLSFEDYQAKVAAGQKWCTGCKAWHPQSDFGTDTSRWDGRKATCAAHGRATHRLTYTPRPKPAPGRRFSAARNDDRKQARGRVNHLVNVGLLPNPNDVPCTDCGHLDPGRKPRHEYDHHLGYGPEHHEDVEPVCTSCHRRRTNARRVAAKGANVDV